LAADREIAGNDPSLARTEMEAAGFGEALRRRNRMLGMQARANGGRLAADLLLDRIERGCWLIRRPPCLIRGARTCRWLRMGKGSRAALAVGGYDPGSLQSRWAPYERGHGLSQGQLPLRSL